MSKYRIVFRVMIIVGLLMMAASSHMPMLFDKDEHHAEPPKGWSIVCDSEGHFAAALDELPGFFLTDKARRPCGPLTTRQQAIDRAWDQENYERREREQKSKWKPEAK